MKALLSLAEALPAFSRPKCDRKTPSDLAAHARMTFIDSSSPSPRRSVFAFSRTVPSGLALLKKNEVLVECLALRAQQSPSVQVKSAPVVARRPAHPNQTR
jgi:hypothetical protein